MRNPSTAGSPEAFRGRLRALTDLGAGEIDALATVAGGSVVLRGERMLFSEGDQPQRLHILVEGWAARVKLMADGRRHLCALLLPGDVCDIDGLHLRRYDYGVVALTACRFATAERRGVLALAALRPRIGQVLAWLGYVDNALLNEAATSLARRAALPRLAHLLCELLVRLEAIGRVAERGFELPLSQEKLGDALGLTAVHVNRTMQRMRADGLIETGDRRLTVPDRTALATQADFNPNYLHLDGIRLA